MYTVKTTNQFDKNLRLMKKKEDMILLFWRMLLKNWQTEKSYLPILEIML